MALLRELFEAAIQLAPGEREAWLEAHCADPAQRAQLRRMLAADDARTALDADVPARLAAQIGEPGAPRFQPGVQIGPFELLAPLGEGGFASVFRAERTSAGVRQTVALKLLRRGLHRPEAQRQFRRERQALAQLQHPNIARLIEGGVTEDGLGYIALELIDGVPITDYAHEHALDLRDRLRLFVQVCRAVEAAHRALIVHRDLKPSNVLVTRDGEVKLLDFGIAKLLDSVEDDTVTQMPAFTPAYAAPEQQRNEPVTTATDVYSLGVLLGELLTGQRLGPSDGRTPSARLRADVPRNIRTPTFSSRDLRGDLDRILDKALAPAPDERYFSAGAFADDVERHLDGRPVRAHPPSLRYRAGKFIARHRGSLALAALVAIAILASLGFALWQAQVARQEAARANTVRGFLLDVFDAARAFAPRDERPTPETLVEQARLRLANTNLDPRTRAEVLRTLGRVDLSLSRFTQAGQAFDEARALAVAQDDAAGTRAADLLRAETLLRAGKHREARPLLEAHLPALRAAPGPELIQALSVSSAVEFDAGLPDVALDRQREAVEAARALYGEDDIDNLTVQLRYGSALAEAQRYPEAVATLEPLLARWRAAHAPEDDRYVAALGSLAAAADGMGDPARTEARLRDVLALKRRIYSEPHHAIASTLRQIGSTVGRDGTRAAEAEVLLQQALTMQRSLFGADHAEIAETLDARGQVLAAQRRLPDAEAAYREALAICERAALKNEVCPRARNNLGMSLYRERKLEEAEAQMRQALAERRALYGNDHPTVAFSLSTLANVAAAKGDGPAAVELSRDAMATLERAGRADSREGVLLRYTLAAALWRADRYAEALPEIDRVLVDWQRVSPDGAPRRVTMLVQKAQILDGLGRLDDARVAAEEAIALGVPGDVLQPFTREQLRRYSGRVDVYPEPQ